MVEVAGAEITVTTDYHKARAMRSCMTRELARVERAARKPFTPAEGKIDANAARIATINAAIADIDRALTAGIAEHKEAANGQG